MNRPTSIRESVFSMGSIPPFGFLTIKEHAIDDTFAIGYGPHGKQIGGIRRIKFRSSKIKEHVTKEFNPFSKRDFSKKTIKQKSLTPQWRE